MPLEDVKRGCCHLRKINISRGIPNQFRPTFNNLVNLCNNEFTGGFFCANASLGLAARSVTCPSFCGGMDVLTQIERLVKEVDGRYATDTELAFMAGYAQSFRQRAQTYLILQKLEPVIVQQVLQRLQKRDPSLLKQGDKDLTAKWQLDTVRVLRYSATAMLLNDGDWLREQLLFWFQTIMRAFRAERSCGVTYEVMQTVVQEQLTPAQAELFCPILELNRVLLGTSDRAEVGAAA